jgi:hypothetical protein
VIRAMHKNNIMVVNARSEASNLFDVRSGIKYVWVFCPFTCIILIHLVLKANSQWDFTYAEI